MSKITLLLWKDFVQNFRLAEGLCGIPCLWTMMILGKVSHQVFQLSKNRELSCMYFYVRYLFNAANKDEFINL